ncbi:UV-endonuclease UvdE [Hymenopellis radicata]|nr:UV-endonuclease UvdE [Hymenopellis radicata]
MSALRRSTRLKAAAAVKIGPVNESINIESEDVHVEQAAEEPSPKKKRKPREPKPEPVYVIPDVEKKTTTFLGYACLNTILRAQKPPVFCSRTCRIDTIKKNGIDFVKDLGRQNCEDLLELIKWNERNAKHSLHARVRRDVPVRVARHVRVFPVILCPAPCTRRRPSKGIRTSAHYTSGQFTQLGSPRPEVITSSIRELQYHTEMLDLMGLGPDAVMIIHGGGLPKNVRDRLVLENDELCYNADDLLPICEELDVPLVFDYHHDALNPSLIPRFEIIDRADAIFRKRGIKPKQHLSEQRPGAESIMERRAHADRCENLPEDLPDDMDLMIEAKDKEQAVLHLYRMYGLETVEFKSLRPPNEHQTKETNGRKSNKRKKVKEADADEEETVNPTRSRRKRAKTLDEDSEDLEGESAKDDVMEEVEEEEHTFETAPASAKKPRKRE